MWLNCRTKRVLSSLVAGIGLICLSSYALSDDWTQWRGPNRNGISNEKGILSRLSGSGPRKVWTAQVGEGFSAVTVRGDKAYTLGFSGSQNTVYCLNTANGKVVWKYSYPCGSSDYAGPRATPALDGDKVYTMSQEAHVHCLNATTGKVVWSKNLLQTYNPEVPQWGFAGSPLVYENMVLVNVGSAGAALDKNTGKVIWFSGKQMAGYATPVPYTMGSQKGVVFFVGWGVVALNPKDGKPFWQSSWQTQYNVNAADPIVSGDTVFISSNYGHGCSLLRINGGKASKVWENRNMKNHFNSCVLLNGYLYGNDDGRLKCLDAKTGQEKWSSRGIDKGGLIAADGKLIVMGGRGELILVAANPNTYTELGRAQVMGGTCWTHPVLSNGFLYCRSHEGELVCLDMRGK